MLHDLDKRAFALRYGPWLACAFALLWHSLQYNFVTDDAYISFVYSRNFAEHGELTFNLGDRVEGYTNFLWTFILGLFMVVKLPPEIMSRVLGTGFAIGTLFVVFRLTEYVYRKATAWDYVPAALLALSSGYACWSSGGLETQMFTFFVAFALYAYARADEQPRWLCYATGALALSAMTRPEGLLVIAVLGGHRVAINLIRDRRWKPVRAEWVAVGVFFAIWAPWFAWRWWYYGHLFPNTYYVKAGGETVRGFKHGQVSAFGFKYVNQWLHQTNVLYVFPLILAGLCIAKPRGRRFFAGTAACAVAAAYLLYTIRVGGDFMGLHRFIMPVFVVAALGMTFGLRLVVAQIRREQVRRYVAPALAGLLVLGYAVDQYRLTRESLRWGNWPPASIDTPAYLWVYTHDRAQIGKHMKKCFRKGDFSIVGGAGAQPYFGRMAGIDVFGLVSWDVAHCDPRRNSRAGHTKWAQPPLLYKQPRPGNPRKCPKRFSKTSTSRRWRSVEGGPPDFVFYCYTIHRGPKAPGNMSPCRRGQRGCRCTQWTNRGYKRVTMHIPGMKQQGEFYTFYVHKDRLAQLREDCGNMITDVGAR